MRTGDITLGKIVSGSVPNRMVSRKATNWEKIRVKMKKISPLEWRRRSTSIAQSSIPMVTPAVSPTDAAIPAQTGQPAAFSDQNMV